MSVANTRSLALPCATCKSSVLIPVTEGVVRTACPQCDAPLEIRAFPALLRDGQTGPAPQAVLSEEESSCFFHPRKRANVACEHCGRFLCALCDIEVRGRHLCTQCLQAPALQDTLKTPQRYIHYDHVAGAVAVFPMIFPPVTLLTAPLALYIALRYWNSPQSAAPRGKGGFVVAILLAVAQIMVWGYLGVGFLLMAGG